jgi:isoleucyl-tRNA synthetase
MHADDEILMYTKESKNILDALILSKCTKLVREVTEYMESYDTVRSARAEKEFVADFSQWYIRRSRSRFKSEDTDHRLSALKTTRYVLITVAKLIAPLTPYIAESVYKGVKGEKESVHLDSWPTVGGEVDENLIEDMAEVRRIASLALELRQKAGIKVRQPLAKLTLSHEKLKNKTDLIKVLLDEINVKEFCSDKKQEDEVVLDTTLTEELKQEGNSRDIVRAVQEMRKKNGLMPEDDVTLIVATNKEGEKMFAVAKDELLRVAGVKKISFGSPKEGNELKVDTTKIVFELSKN